MIHTYRVIALLDDRTYAMSGEQAEDDAKDELIDALDRLKPVRILNPIRLKGGIIKHKGVTMLRLVDQDAYNWFIQITFEVTLELE